MRVEERAGLQPIGDEVVVLRHDERKARGPDGKYIIKKIPGTLAKMESSAEVGGQNPGEPAALGKPVVIGPHMENFAEIAAAAEAPFQALTTIDDVYPDRPDLDR